MARAILKAGFSAMPILASFIVDWKKQTAQYLASHVALQAGLGFLGPKQPAIHPEYGAGIRLASILTDMPLTTDTPSPKTAANVWPAWPHAPPMLSILINSNSINAMPKSASSLKPTTTTC